MKKLSVLFIGLVLILTLSACGGGNDVNCDPGFTNVDGKCVEDNTNTEKPTFSGVADVEITVGDAFNALDGVTASDASGNDLTSSITISGEVDVDTIAIYTLTYEVTDSNGLKGTATREVSVVGLDGCAVHFQLVNGVCEKIPAEVITIMHGAVYEIDPFHDDYSGTEQLARQDRQREVEAQYNVVINYENYPPAFGWGPDRVREINRASTNGEPVSDIYWITSDWIQQLVAGNSLADVSGYLDTIGSNIPESYQDIGEYQGGVYGFESYKPSINYGLYYNAGLVDELGVDNPTDLYLDGEWNWSKFEEWATEVQTALDGGTEERYALGGMLSYYAEAMTTLNGGSLINKQSGRVAFSQNPALETYDYLTTLWNKGLFEPSADYDAGSVLWRTGKVAVHPGALWFMTAENRWASLEFEIGFVPYPVADDYTDEYISPIGGVAIMALASGMTPEREELVFTVWNELQLWKTEAESDSAFRVTLLQKFDDAKYVDAYLEVYDSVYLDITNSLGISAYGEQGWRRNINISIKDGSSRTAMEQIKPNYQTALADYLGE